MPLFSLRAIFLMVCALVATAGASPATPPREARWNLAIDSRDTSGPWLSVRRGTVYSLRDGHVVAVDLGTGRIRWHSKVRTEGRPAVGGRAIFAPIGNGIVALDPATGKEIGRRAYAATPTLLTMDFAAVAILNEGYDRGLGHARMLGLRDSLEPRWQRQLRGEWVRPDSVGGKILVLFEDTQHSGGTGVIAFDERNGNAMAATDGVEDYVGRDGQTLWFSVAGGGLKSLDLDKNESVAIHNSIVRDAVRVEGRTAVAVVDGRLARVSLPDGAVTPLRVDGRWVGGPANGTLFLSRGDGTYAQRLDGGKAVRIATNTSDARFLTSTGNRAFFATNDGSVIAADLKRLSPTVRFATACRFVEGIRLVAGAALVHCDDVRMASRLWAFDLDPGPR